ncbi:spondin domain-containing protein [Ferrimonas pelagia]|uniref:Spondin domain-containing protein n=1 Tax=Ferrimonas pelagia TaxID=1177826 RepID=A0ABP9FAY2_9GAMM
MKLTSLVLPVGAALLLAGCPGDNDNDPVVIITPPPAMMAFEISVTNLTSAQPMSPVAAYLHDGSVNGWRFGMPASVALEELAEGGDGNAWLTMAQDNGAYSQASGDGILMPGAQQTVNIEMLATQGLHLTLATMLVNTNDAFAGVDGRTLADLAVNQSFTMTLPVYDAGTEANSELAATIPGPAGGGAGFDSNRDDVDYVARHGGVVSLDDGYAQSALLSLHRFDAPVARLSVTRTR